MKSLFVAQESIQFQKDSKLFNALTAAFEDSRRLDRKTIPESEEVARLGHIIEDLTGIRTVMVVDGNGPAVEVPDISKNSPLVSDLHRMFLSNADGMKLVAATGRASGSVNLKTSTVSGVFRQVECRMHWVASLLDSKSSTTSEENAAICLHEIGHVFVYFECLARSITTNQVLSGIARIHQGSASAHERETILLSAKNAMKLSNEDMEALSKSTTQAVSEAVVLSAAIKQSKSELGTDIYDCNNWEYLADEFAARHGAGRHLTTSLSKIYKSSYHIATRGMAGYLLMEALKLSMFAGIFIAGPFASFIAGQWSILTLMDGLGDPTYDRPMIRIRRIRNQLVEAIKDPKLSPKQIDSITDDIRLADEYLAEMNTRMQLTNIIWHAFSKNQRSRLAAEKLQQELESLANNNLFVAAANLRN